MVNGMFTTERLNELRSLNGLDKERRATVAESAAGVGLEERQTALRAHLPAEVLAFHDRFARRAQPSVVPLSGVSCSACHLKLPSGVLGELRPPNRFSLCPTCGVFVWSGDQPIAVVVQLAPPEKKVRRKKVYA